MKSTPTLWSLCALALLSPWAQAQNSAPTTTRTTTTAAENTASARIAQPSDEQPSEGEALAAKQFKWLDLNGDGYLTKGEVALFPRLRDAFDAADANHDGKVSFEEIRAYAKEQRSQKDKADKPTVQAKP
jgi:hypothetical protein